MKAKESTPSRGIFCPVCRFSESEVDQTLRIRGRVRRYRSCKRCGARYRTSEKWDPPGPVN